MYLTFEIDKIHNNFQKTHKISEKQIECFFSCDKLNLNILNFSEFLQAQSIVVVVVSFFSVSIMHAEGNVMKFMLFESKSRT